jgi:flagellar motor switch protein FliM
MADQANGAGDGEMSEEERLAAEWAAADSGDSRVLNQNEIDSLLGVASDDDASNKSGIRAIINSALVSYERLPMLEVVFDRLIRLLSTSLRNFTSDNVEINLDNITSVRFGDYLNSIPLPAMINVVKAEEWENYCLMTVDSALIYSIVDVLLGGRRGAALRIEGRPYTTIERNLVEKMMHVILADLSAAFDPVSPVTFRFDRMETNPRFAAIARPANAAILARFRVEMEERGGRIELLIPYATLEPVRELLLQMFMGEKFGRDAIWETHLATALWHTEIEIEAVLAHATMSLNDAMNLKVGSRIMLDCAPDPLVQVRCADVELFNGRMGRKGPNIAIKVENGRFTSRRTS